MKWYLLKSNKCPKCSSVLIAGGVGLACSKMDCDFTIGNEKFTELSNKYVQKYNSHDKFEDAGGWGRFN